MPSVQWIVRLVVGGFLLLLFGGMLRAVLGDAGLLVIVIIVAFAALVRYARVHPGWLILISVGLLVIGGLFGLFAKRSYVGMRFAQQVEFKSDL